MPKSFSGIGSVLIVCHGNTCRSPMAEAIAREMIGKTSNVQSAGIETCDDSCATKHAVQVMEERGLDIRNHRSRDADSVDPASFDVFIAMDEDIGRSLVALGVDPSRIVEFDIPDPYGRGIEAYRRAADDIAIELRRLF